MPSYSLGSHLLPATESGPSHCWLLQERWRTSHLYRCIYTFRYTKLYILEQRSQPWRLRAGVQSSETTQHLRHMTIPGELEIQGVRIQGLHL